MHNEILEADNQRPDILNNLARIDILNGEFTEAESKLEKAIQLDRSL